MKICLILADGMRPDSIAEIKEAEDILKSSQYTMNAKTVLPSVTLPCHISLFLSVEPSRHGTVTNTYTPQVRPVRDLIDVLRNADKSSAVFYDWEALRDISKPGNLTAGKFLSGRWLGYDNTDVELTDSAIETMKTKDIDFTFLYLGVPDSKGHSIGWMSEEYIESVKLCWKNITKVREAMGDEYLYIVTADHGGHGRTHGLDIPEDTTIPIIIFGNTEGRKFDLENANIMDIAPTVTDIFGIKPDPDWEGKSLVKN